jgi:hypothetical protein
VARPEGRGAPRLVDGPTVETPGVVAPLAPSLAEPIADRSAPIPYRVAADRSLLDPLWPKGTHAYIKASPT